MLPERPQLATVDVSGVRRSVNIMMLADEAVQPGDWVLIHVGFAMAWYIPPLDALQVARQNPDRQVVFMAIGFETTVPSTARTVLPAAQEGVRNFTIFCNHVLIIPAIKAILDALDLRLDGFIGPGHVSTVIGCRPYEFIPRDSGKPVVIAGFEPLDILQAIYPGYFINRNSEYARGNPVP